MKTCKLFTGILLGSIALLAYGCFGFTEKTAEPTDTEVKEFELITWEEYKDTDFGVSFKYPSNWEIEKDDSEILTLTPITTEDAPSPYFVKLVRLDNSANKPAPEALNFADNYSMSKIGVDDLVAIKRAEPPESLSHFYYVERFPYIYKFVYMNLSDRLDYITDQAFYELLSSFRFIPYTGEEVAVEEDAGVEEPEDVEEEVEEDAGAEEPEEAEEDVEEEPTASSNTQQLVSGPYKFEASVPLNWYYQGAHFGGTDGILHRYSFSAKEDGDSIAALDIVDEAMPSGSNSVDGRSVSKTVAGGKVIIYVKLSDQVYKIVAPEDLENAADAIALSIVETE
ncbi:MAG: hypothetical protein ABH856_00610 [Patescibacteria group bacterium]